MAKEYVKQAVSSDGTRTISAQRGFSLARFLFQWEWMLVLMLILVKYLIYRVTVLCTCKNNFKANPVTSWIKQ